MSFVSSKGEGGKMGKNPCSTCEEKFCNGYDYSCIKLQLALARTTGNELEEECIDEGMQIEEYK